MLSPVGVNEGALHVRSRAGVLRNRLLLAEATQGSGFAPALCSDYQLEQIAMMLDRATTENGRCILPTSRAAAMSKSVETPVNPLNEESLLGQAALARWRGFPLEWVSAGREAALGPRAIATTHLAMLDAGSARAEFRLAGRTHAFNVSPGAIGLFAAGTELGPCRWWCNEGVRRIMVLLDFDRVCDDALAQALSATHQQTALEFHDPELAAVMRRMALEVASGCRNGTLYAQSLSLGVAMCLKSQGATRWLDHTERGKLSRQAVERLRECITSNLAADLSLKTLAKESGFSPAQFVRLFKNTFGCTPHQYVLQARVAWCDEQVLRTNTPLSVVAHEAGFASQSHMNAAFVRTLGTSPGRRRREARPGSVCTLYLQD